MTKLRRLDALLPFTGIIDHKSAKVNVKRQLLSL